MSIRFVRVIGVRECRDVIFGFEKGRRREVNGVFGV